MSKVQWTDQPKEHFERLFVSTPTALGGCAVLVLGVVAWLLATVEPAALRASLAAALVIAAVGSLLAGNTFRLRDIRKRRAYQLRVLQDGDLRVEAWSQLVPRSTIAVRFGLAAAAMALGVVTFAGNLSLASGGVDIGLSFTASLLGAITCIVCAVVGTFIRSFD